MAAAAAPRRHEKRGPRGRRQRGDARLQGYSKTWGGHLLHRQEYYGTRGANL